MNFIQRLLGGLSDEDQKVLDDLKDSGVMKACVVEFSSVQKDAEDVASSLKFQRYAERAEQFVERQCGRACKVGVS